MAPKLTGYSQRRRIIPDSLEWEIQERRRKCSTCSGLLVWWSLLNDWSSCQLIRLTGADRLRASLPRSQWCRNEEIESPSTPLGNHYWGLRSREVGRDQRWQKWCSHGHWTHHRDQRCLEEDGQLPEERCLYSDDEICLTRWEVLRRRMARASSTRSLVKERWIRMRRLLRLR